MPHVRAGRLRAYGVSLVNGSTLAPGIEPLARGANIPGFNLGAWIGLMVPAATPTAIIERLSALMMEIMATTEMRDRFAAVGVEVDARPATAFADYLREQRQIFTEAVRRANIRPE
jgi:tripartite-type tricarboxylate transporter receptor subunit TctC